MVGAIAPMVAIAPTMGAIIASTMGAIATTTGAIISPTMGAIALHGDHSPHYGAIAPH